MVIPQVPVIVNLTESQIFIVFLWPLNTKSAARGGTTRVSSFPLYNEKSSKLLLSYALIPQFPEVCRTGVESVPVIVANVFPVISYTLNSRYVVSSDREFTINSPLKGPPSNGVLFIAIFVQAVLSLYNIPPKVLVIVISLLFNIRPT
jgi:hypothetical protein